MRLAETDQTGPMLMAGDTWPGERLRNVRAPIAVRRELRHAAP